MVSYKALNTAIKTCFFYDFNTFRNYNVFQTTTQSKSSIANTIYTIRNYNLLEIFTTTKRKITNSTNAFRNCVVTIFRSVCY